MLDLIRDQLFLFLGGPYKLACFSVTSQLLFQDWQVKLDWEAFLEAFYVWPQPSKRLDLEK